MVVRLLAALLACAWCTTAQAATVTRGEATIEYTDSGSGPAIVLVPSLGRGRTDFDDLTRRLVESGFRVVVADPRGVGGSHGPMAGLTLHDLAADIAAVVEQAGAKPVTVLGHAFGNTVARTFATDRPDLVRGVILLAASGRAPLSAEIRTAIAKASDLDLPPPQRLHYLQEGYFAAGADASSWLEGWFPAAQTMEWGAFNASKPGDYVTAGGTMPILEIQGAEDVIIPSEYSLDLQNELGPRVTVVRIPKAGHAMLPEQPAAISTAITDWMQRFR